MLEVIELNGVKTTKTAAATNHVYLVDVSGSMYSSLPKMKEHLKNSISLLSQPGDTFSIIYFSGRGQCGVVCEGMEVKDVSQMTALHTAVDRWLNVIGLTGFIEPLQLAMDIGNRMSNGNPNNFVMLTDGYDNCWAKKDIVNKAELLPTVFSSCSFIEFGWYCDRALIAKLAEVTSGVHLFSDGYQQYTKAFEDAVTGAVRVPKIAVNVNKKAKHVIYIQDGQIIISEPSNGVVHVPETVTRVHSIVPKDVLSKQLSNDHVFMIMYYAVKHNNAKLVWNCLEQLGDVRLIDMYSNAFSRQELSTFLDAVKAAALDPSERFKEGQDTSYVPAKDAYTVVDLLNSLASEEDVQLNMSEFEYKRTGKKKKQTETLPRFVKTMKCTQQITVIVAHSSRANFSIQVVEEGNVLLPENDFNLEKVASKRTKNYTIIRDGIINVDILPVVVSKEWVDRILDDNNVGYQIIDSDNTKVAVNITLSSLPVINRNMIENVTLEDFKELVEQLQMNAAKQKVAKHFKPVNRTSGLADQYGAEAAKWLGTLGVRDYGFSPKVSSDNTADDFYFASELKFAVKGLSSLPSINAVEKKIKEGKKLTVSEVLIDDYLSDGMVWAGKTDEIIKQQRELHRRMSEYVYSLIVGRTWFAGFDDRKAETNVVILGRIVKMTVSLDEIQIAI